MIEFNDISHWNTETQFEAALLSPIIAHKATQGLTFRDAALRKRAALIPVDKVLILYHYITPAKGDHAGEVKNFLSYARELFAGRPVVLAVDYEKPDATNTTAHFQYLVRFLTEVDKQTGKTPYVYINASQLDAAEKLGFSFPWLWIAKWSRQAPAHDCGIWQYTNRDCFGMDANKFMVDDIALLRRHEVMP